jgi:hypothetical protein
MKPGTILSCSSVPVKYYGSLLRRPVFIRQAVNSFSSARVKFFQFLGLELGGRSA